VPVRKVFICYARQNKPDVEQLVEHLGVLGCETWHDSSLHGGQDWWEEILRRITDCDTFVAIISRDALSSTACRREFDWAESLNKPVLPVAVEPPPKALPRRFSKRQIVDYSDRESRDRAALTLAGGLATLSSAPPVPDSLPVPPAAPLSYLTDLIDLVTEHEALDHGQQRDILNQLEPALRSVDPEERRGASDILEMLSSRDDLYADVDRTITRLRDLADAPAASRSDDQHTAQTASIAVGPEPSASTHGTVLGAEVWSPEKPRHQPDTRPEHRDVGERPAAQPSRGEATDVAESTNAALPDAEPETSNDAAASAEYKQVTVLFADVVDSMDIAAAVGVERLREIMTDLADRCAAVVQRYGGTVDQVTGYGIMAVFGAPTALEDPAARACLAP
jgi:hypothetical protein